MAVSTAHKYKVQAALMQFAKTGLFPYYSECGFGGYGPGKDVLDEISRDPQPVASFGAPTLIAPGSGSSSSLQGARTDPKAPILTRRSF
jgi:hypothetical protein